MAPPHARRSVASTRARGRRARRGVCCCWCVRRGGAVDALAALAGGGVTVEFAGTRWLATDPTQRDRAEADGAFAVGDGFVACEPPASGVPALGVAQGPCMDTAAPCGSHSSPSSRPRVNSVVITERRCCRAATRRYSPSINSWASRLMPRLAAAPRSARRGAGCAPRRGRRCASADPAVDRRLRRRDAGMALAGHRWGAASSVTGWCGSTLVACASWLTASGRQPWSMS